MMERVVYCFWLLAMLSPSCFALPSNSIPLGGGTGIELSENELSNSLPGEEGSNIFLNSALQDLQKMIVEKMEEAMMTTLELKLETESLREENARLSARLQSLEAQTTGCGCTEEIARIEERMNNIEASLGGSSVESTPPTTEMVFETTPYYWRRTTRAPRISNTQGLVTYILVTEEGKVLMADYNEQEIKITETDDINHLVETLYLGMTPWSMTQLSDGTIVVTCENEPKMSFLRMQDSGLQIERTIHLDRRYRGITECGSNGSLIASSRKNMDDYPEFEANINVITRDGEVVETLLSGADYSNLDKPFFLTCRGNDLFISDWTSHRVIVLNVDTHTVTSSFGNMDLSTLGLYQPRVVAFDQHENMYVATGGRVCNRYYSGYFCIIQVSPNGQWKHLEEFHSNGGSYPYGVAVTDTEIYISWGTWKYGTWYTYLTSYPLPMPLEEATTLPTTTFTPEDTTPVTSIFSSSTSPEYEEYDSDSDPFYVK